MKTPKVVADPLYGIIDIRPVISMVETKEFQSLGDKRQLGMAYLTFPSATHSRKEHSLGAYHATRELADWWIKLGFISEKEGRALAGYALYHDIGHPAFSHVTEDLCPVPATNARMSVNSALSLAIIQKRRKEIEACGIDFKLMEAMATHKNPLYLAVSDKNLGMEKLDYLERDGAYTILSRPVGVDYLRHHIYFINGQLAIDEKVVDNAIEVQNFYLKIYKNVYLRKTSAIAQRMMQKMTHHLILSGALSREDLPELTDSELLGIMRFSSDEFVMKTYELLKHRDLFREAIVIRPTQFARSEAGTDKHIAVFGATKRDMDRLAKNPALQPKNQNGLAEMEEKIAALAGLPRESVLITPIYGQERFEAQDIVIYEGRGKKLASLKKRYPAHFKNIEEVAQTYLAFRVCTTEKYRKTLSVPRTATRVFQLLMRHK
jgi:HD superfamily phosphohydrolase